MQKEKIANHQLGFILFVMRATVIISYLPVLTTADALQDAWISTLLVLVTSLFFVFLIASLDLKFPELTIVEYSQQLLGVWWGRLVSLIIIWTFLQFLAVEIRLYAEIVVTAFLVNTPIIVMALGITMTAALAVYMGLETLARATDLLFFFLVIMLIIIILITLREVDLINLQPVLARGWQPVVRGALNPSGLMAFFWVFSFLNAETVKPQKNLQTALLAIGIAIITLLIIVIITIGVLGADPGMRATFPFLTLMRSIKLSQFLQRIEILLITVWGFGIFVSIGTHLYCLAKGTSQLLKLKDYRSLLWPLAIIAAFLAIQGFEDLFAINTFIGPGTFVPYSFIILVLPLLLLWSAYGIRSLFNRGGY